MELRSNSASAFASEEYPTGLPLDVMISEKNSSASSSSVWSETTSPSWSPSSPKDVRPRKRRSRLPRFKSFTKSESKKLEAPPGLRRERRANFTPDEKNLLKELLLEYKGICPEFRGYENITWQNWKEITAEYARRSKDFTRGIGALKSCWASLKNLENKSKVSTSPQYTIVLCRQRPPLQLPPKKQSSESDTFDYIEVETSSHILELMEKGYVEDIDIYTGRDSPTELLVLNRTGAAPFLNSGIKGALPPSNPPLKTSRPSAVIAGSTSKQNHNQVQKPTNQNQGPDPNQQVSLSIAKDLSRSNTKDNVCVTKVTTLPKTPILQQTQALENYPALLQAQVFANIPPLYETQDLTRFPSLPESRAVARILISPQARDRILPKIPILSQTQPLVRIPVFPPSQARKFPKISALSRIPALPQDPELTKIPVLPQALVLPKIPALSPATVSVEMPALSQASVKIPALSQASIKIPALPQTIAQRRMQMYLKAQKDLQYLRQQMFRMQYFPNKCTGPSSPNYNGHFQ